MENKRQKVEIADIFRRFESDYQQQSYMTHEQQKAFNAIMNCRSQGLGGHTLKCNNCGHVEHAYNSCRNRHCPKCQYLKQVVLVNKLKARLLPVKYFHVVFTIPASMHKLFYANQGICYDLLMKSASQAILKAGENPRFPGAKTGCVAVKFYSNSALTQKTGLKYYTVKPYFFIERDPVSNNVLKATALYLPDLENPQYMVLKEGLGATKVDLKLTDGSINTLGLSSDAKISETLNALAGLISKSTGAVTDLSTLKEKLPAASASAITELYEVSMFNGTTTLKKIEIK